ncbi:MAG: DNA alkylation repair protein [Verrucomicrobiales bacterium]|nr:DNA alkylation repair protein [Verrucomicrobiales bacterium]
MPPKIPNESRPQLLKEWFNEPRYRRLAAQLGALEATFDRERFLSLTLDGLSERSLMDRLRQAALAVDAALPGSYRAKLSVLHRLAPQIGHDFVAMFACEFVVRFGLADFDHSMEALRQLTCFGSAEFAVRPFLVQDLERGLAILNRWTHDQDEKVRRLASEGSRPRLPWGVRLQELTRDPAPLAPILEALKGDESLYVRRSVANSLNDVAKDHPDWVLARLHAWDLTAAGTAWVARHASRTLIKQGHPDALRLFGFRRAAVEASLTVRPEALILGGTLVLSATLQSTAARTQKLAVDYAVHYVRPGGAIFRKVFKWREVELPAGGALSLTKQQVFRDMSARRHHDGRHLVELQINGQPLAQHSFILRTGG